MRCFSLEGKDRRIRRTYKFLQRALIELLQKNEISEISIKMLCERAQVTRQTFYAHFENLQDFIEYVSKFMLDDFRSEVHIFEPKLQHNFMDLKTHESIVRIFQHVLENKVFYEAFLVNNPNSPFALGLKEEIKHFVLSGVDFVAPDDAQLFPVREVIIEYVTAGYFESIIWWIKQKYPYTIERMAEMLLYISTRGPYQLMSKEKK